MLTSLNCLAKADEMAAHALTCVKQVHREGYADLAPGWRRAAALADGPTMPETTPVRYWGVS